MMGRNEERTLANLKSARSSLIDPAIATHRGRIVKTTGDGMLIEFASAVDATRAAIEVQRSMAEQNAPLPHELRLEFRVGIHIGDIIIDADDIFGDGVNIAVRMERIAEPGGIYLSDDAYRQVRAKVDVVFDDMGLQTLKNITEPMRAWRARVHDVKDAAPAVKPVRPALPLPDKPSIAVLPFQNMSGDPEQEYFADGMVEEIITALSRFKSLFVIARNSSFAYKDKAIDIKRVGRELGVRYVLEGSVRKAGNRVRITGQLIEAASGNHIWADRFDGELEDVFGLQDKVTSSVVGLIAPRLEQAEFERTRHKPTEKLDSYDLHLRGMALIHQRASLADAYDLFKQAIELDPDFAAAHAMLAWTWMGRQATSGAPLDGPERFEAIKHARLASRLGEEDALVLSTAGHVLTYLGHDYDLGSSMVEEAIVLNPNLGFAWYSRGWVALMCGDTERAIESFDHMMRLSPLDPLRISAWIGTSHAFFWLGRYEEGCEAAKRSLRFNTNAHSLGAFIINAIRAGRTDEAHKAIARLLRVHPGFRTSHVSEAFPVRGAALRDQIGVALRDAGLPE
ncbi:adenylate/guanylate cyclase domain-containing protein [Bradyrhizobium genosp. L]|nr:adenylate/guanylate cyclase domain-containing protein [Bradyrhizobium genosp. L]